LFTFLTLWLTIHPVVHFSLPAVKLLEVLAHYANTSKETLSPFIDSSIDNVQLQTNLVTQLSHAPFEPIVTKFCVWGRVGDAITGAKFYGNRLRVFGVTGPPSQTPFPILNDHRPYDCDVTQTNHVTIWFTVGDFLQVVHCDHASILHRYEDMAPQTGFLKVCTPIMSTYRTFINFMNFSYIHVLILKNEN